MIARGVAEKRLVLVEYDPGFCALMRERYPQATVIQGDAYNLDQTLSELSAPGSAMVSGLPLVTKPMLTRVKLMRDAFLKLEPARPSSSSHIPSRRRSRSRSPACRPRHRNVSG